MRLSDLTLCLGLSLLSLVAVAQEPSREPAPAASGDLSPRPATLVERAEDAGQELMLTALASLGVKYRFGSNNPLDGLDCSGFVQHVFHEATGIMLPHNAYSLSREGTAVQPADLRPGDLVFFKTLRHTFSHVGIYIGDNRFIHAPSRGKFVEIVDMSEAYWTKRFNGARRLLTGAPAPDAVQALSATASPSATVSLTAEHSTDLH